MLGTNVNVVNLVKSGLESMDYRAMKGDPVNGPGYLAVLQEFVQS